MALRAGHSYGPTSFLQQQRHSLYPAPFSPSSEHRLSLSLANLKKYTKYSVVVQAYNRLGAGPRSEEINVMTGEDGVYLFNGLICQFANSCRTSRLSFSTLLALVPSSPPRNVQCSPLTSTSLLILWSPPPVRDMNGKLKDYSVVYRPLKEWEGEARGSTN